VDNSVVLLNIFRSSTFDVSPLIPNLARATRQCRTIKPIRIQTMGKFQIKKLTNSFRFFMKAGNGQSILTSEFFGTKEACLNAIESVKQNASDKNRYEFKKSLNLKHYFNVTDIDGNVIGSSEMYESSSGRDIGIELVKVNASIAVLEDLT
jgi:uncharacterized protein